MTDMRIYADTGRAATRPPGAGPSWVVFGLANLVVVTALAVAFWFLFVDPEWGLVQSYPEPYTALLFWALIALVWIGFNQEFTAFTRFRQPLKGLAIVAVVAVFAFSMTYALAYLWGSIDLSFAADREGGVGFFTGALWVLFAFIVYVMSVVNWQHWPSSQSGLKQPWIGAAQIVVLAVPTSILYLIFGLPSLATWVDPAAAVLDTNTAIGVFYGIVVSVVITGLLTENWPWRLMKTPGKIALVSAIGNAVAGVAIYFVLRALTPLLIGSTNADALGDSIAIFPAQIGVCWVFWMIFWTNCFGNKPTGASDAVNAIARVGITFVLGVVTFLLYYFVLADFVLHEPELLPGLAGNALGWMDWWVMWTLIYVLCFESLGLSKLRPAASV